jgi:hypothetical protein
MPNPPCPECGEPFTEPVLFAKQPSDKDWFRCLKCRRLWSEPKQPPPTTGPGPMKES